MNAAGIIIMYFGGFLIATLHPIALVSGITFAWIGAYLLIVSARR